jgi:hypothetical protein
MFLRNVSGTFKVRLLPDVLKDDPVPLSVHWLLDTCVAEPDGGRQLSKRCSPTQALIPSRYGGRPDQPRAISASISVFVIAAGGNNNSVIRCSPAPPATVASCSLPQVIAVSPENAATSVPPTILPQITFNEPTTHVTTKNVILTDNAGKQVPVRFLRYRTRRAALTATVGPQRPPRPMARH